MPIDWTYTEVRLNHRGRVRCEPGWRLAPEWSDRLTDFDLWFVWAGRGTMQLRENRLDLRPGVCLWMRPGGRYLAEQDPADRLGVTWVHFDLLDGRGRRLGHAHLPPEVHEVLDLDYAGTLLARVAQRAMPDAARLSVFRGLLIEIEAGTLTAAHHPAAGTPAHHREVVARAVARLQNDLAAAPAVAELAEASGYSADHFSRIFRDVTGRSPQDHLVALRIDRARQLLVESSLTVTQIAELLGYRDVYFFSRQFKQRSGRSPSEYRKSPGPLRG